MLATVGDIWYAILMEISLLRHQSQLITLPFRHREIRHFFLVGGYGCVSGDTLIDTPNGKVRIDSFGGGEVYAWNPALGVAEVARAKKPVMLGKAKMARLSLSNGKSIDCSLDHRFLCYKGDYKPAGEIAVGERLKTQCGFCTVDGKQEIGESVVWDMTVPFYHSYISNGVISHNCGKSFSDVMLIMELARRYPKLKAGAMFGVASLSGVLFTTTIGNTVEALCKETGIKYRLDKRDNIMYVGGARFKIFNLEDYTSIAGFNFSVVLMDELDELPQAKALGAYKACRERCRVTLPDGREPFLVTTTTAQGKRGIYKIIQDLKREIGIDGEGTKTCVIHGRTIDNTNNDPTYYQDLYRAYDDMERKAYLDGEFVSLESGRVYPKYSSDRNDCEPFEVEDYEDIYIGQDLNLGFSSAVACVVREGIIYVVKAYSFDDIWYAPETFRADFPTNSIEWFPDSSSKDIFSLHGYKQQISQQDIRTRISTVNPSIIARTAMVNILLRQGRIRVCRNKSTAHLREGLDMRGFDKKGNPEKGEGRDAYDHMTDSLEYVTFRLVQDRNEFSDIRRLRMVGQYRTLSDKE